MGRELKIILIIIAGIGIIIQFVPSPLPGNSETETYDFISENKVPADIGKLIQTSCYDCHSQEVKYPWYSYIAPVKWQIAKDVNMGRKNLDFSYWDQLEKREKLKKLSEIADEVSLGSMPMRIYTIMHKDARLSQLQRDQIVTWTEEFAEKILED
jgi:hypothetical protein